MLDNILTSDVGLNSRGIVRDRQPGSAVMDVRRPLNMEDVEQMVRLGALMAAEGNYADIPYSPDKLKLLGSYIVNTDVDEQVYFARGVWIDGLLVAQMVGFVSEYWFSYQKIIQDNALYVHPDYRKGTAAMRLVKEFIKWANKVDAVEICCGITVGVNNDTAAKLYERLGFQRVGYIYKRKVT